MHAMARAHQQEQLRATPSLERALSRLVAAVVETDARVLWTRPAQAQPCERLYQALGNDLDLAGQREIEEASTSEPSAESRAVVGHDGMLRVSEGRSWSSCGLHVASMSHAH